MIRINDIHAIKLIAMAARLQFVPGLHHCIAHYSNDDRLMGGTLYTDYWGGSVGCHFAGFAPNWINKELLWLGFDYPFNQLKVNKLLGLIPETNTQSLAIGDRLGFKVEYTVKDIFSDRTGMVITSMLRDECRWLDMKMPYIEYAPEDRMNSLPLELIPTVGMMQ